MNNLINDTIKELNKNGFEATYFDNILEAKNYLLNEINDSIDIGIGGSMTIYNSGLHNDFIKRGNKVFWHWLVEPEERDNIFKKAQQSPVYLSSSNAITSDGKIVNIDGVGNRVSSMFYGHNTVYIIAGKNKISKNIDTAIERIKNEACPKNAERLDLDTPCRHTGRCTDCKSNDRMCNVTVILEGKPAKTNINILLVNEDLGY